MVFDLGAIFISVFSILVIIIWKDFFIVREINPNIIIIYIGFLGVFVKKIYLL